MTDWLNILLLVAIGANLAAFADSLRRIFKMRRLTKQLNEQITQMDALSAKQQRVFAAFQQVRSDSFGFTEKPSSDDTPTMH